MRAFANAADYALKATYGYKEYLDLYYEINGNSFKFVSGENNEYFEFSGSELKIKIDAPVNKSFNLYAKAQHGGIESERTTIQIQSKYILDIISTTIDGNGLVNGLEGLYERDSNTSDIEKVRIKISRSSDTLLEKTIVTKDPSLRLQLCVPVKGGSYNLEYEVFFNENGNQYSYVLPKVTTFNGISSISDLESYYNSIVMLNFAGGASSSNYTIQKNVKALFVYGNNNTVNTLFNINNDDKNTFDMHLESINFNSGGNCININNTGNASLTINGNVSLTAKSGTKGSDGASYDINSETKDPANYGGSGTSGSNGCTGIYANCNLTIVSNGTLSVYAGNGGNGGRGGNGEGSDQAGNGRAGDGGKGGAGGHGGTGIIVTGTLELNGQRIVVQGGSGGLGGNGGYGGNDADIDSASTADDGGDGGAGGRGGDSGHGIQAKNISIQCSTLQITTKKAGNGGRGGNGGHARLIIATNKSLRGAGGAGGNGGNSGSGIVTQSSISHSCTIGDAGSGGGRGTDGTTNNNDVKVRPNSNYAGSNGSKGSNVTRG